MGAPAFLDGYWEFHIFLVVAAVAVAVAMALQVVQTADNRYRFAALLATGLTFGVAVALGTQINNRVNFERSGKFLVSRNFYSAIQVQDVWTNDENLHQMQMVHGQTLHGIQFQKPERRAWHTSYFGEDSGLGVAMEYHPGRAAGRPLRVGVIGLGTGSVASYARRGDVLRYYEIDPQVDRIAHEHFSYLDDARARGAAVDVLLGDARIVLERERDRGDLQRFDIVVVDAFNSDAIPVHLLTREAVELYRAHLVPDGLIVVNTSNRFLDLTPVMRALAEENRLDIRVFTSHDDTERALNRSEFVVLTGNRGFLEDPAVTREADPIIEGKPPVLWTDDYSALLPLLRF
jgi:hypothetical protein